ncbi:alkaline phosphatase family protein [Robertkochia marina]|uniref:Alkaline phosphatase family protein n=1 Tax=Robertkochia marina TaxID=1227945 RepID=A0A4S3M4Q4_9FLAO|nr:alkaline phosphatase PafA [Robertkochia marina]THD69890.1 alkaline phosphatase family protein [Robertkochia marina]TRZ46762.1 alkaline phosphatase family protein [Robertkochia marina]
MKKIFTSICLLAFLFKGFSQETSIAVQPKLVVGIVVDQMRYDYLTRYWNRYGEGGFKRLVGEGFNFKNHHFNYVPTATAPGHASVYTGATPSEHGIIGNEWFDVYTDKVVYCVSDTNYDPVGTKSDAGQMSPHRLMKTTVTDELRAYTNYRGKTVAIAIKDRGAVLPAGFTGDAYWFYGKDEGRWITSSYYKESLPSWVDQFNKGGAAAAYKKVWEPLYDLNTYTSSNPDDSRFEREDSRVFPYDLPELWADNGGYDIIKATPFGNSLTTDFAIAALEGESLGDDADIDFLSISYSSTDYVGHKWGVKAVETEDTYLRLDKDLERLLHTLDKKIGQGEYLVFLTADHGASYNPNYLTANKMPGGFFKSKEMIAAINEFTTARFGSSRILRRVGGGEIYLRKEVLDSLGFDKDEVEEILAEELITYDQVEKVYTSKMLMENEYQEGIARLARNGYHPKLSGDLRIIFNPGLISSGYSRGGTSHGTAWVYDTHVPFILYGSGIPKGSSALRSEIPDIAPTISVLLGIPFPSGVTGKVRAEIFGQ